MQSKDVVHWIMGKLYAKTYVLTQEQGFGSGSGRIRIRSDPVFLHGSRSGQYQTGSATLLIGDRYLNAFRNKS